MVQLGTLLLVVINGSGRCLWPADNPFGPDLNCDTECNNKRRGLLLLTAPTLEPLVRFHNQSGASENYFLYRDASCAEDSTAYSYPSAAHGITTISRKSYTTNIKIGSTCVGELSIPTNRSLAEGHVVTCTSGTSTLSCTNRAAQTFNK